MRRTVPLLITIAVGVILIASRFVPAAQSWGEVAAIWFDILAAVAFVLGGGSLFKLQLRKISDRAAGWGYSVITLVAFLIMLFVGLGKVASHPADQQEFYGESFAPLAVADLPPSTIVRVAGTIPRRTDGEQLPLSVKRQLSEEQGQLVFRGWMTQRQLNELTDYDDTLAWRCAVERLYEASQPKPPIKGKVQYRADHSALSANGFVSDELLAALVNLRGTIAGTGPSVCFMSLGSGCIRCRRAQLPAGYQIPSAIQESVIYDAATHNLRIQGPISPAVRDTLAKANFPQVHPLSAAARDKFRRDLESLGSPLNAEQAVALDGVLAKSWVVDKLRVALDEAGKGIPIEKTPCEQLQERDAAPPQTPPRSRNSPRRAGPI